MKKGQYLEKLNELERLAKEEAEENGINVWFYAETGKWGEKR